MKRSTAIGHLMETAKVSSEQLRFRGTDMGWPVEALWVTGDLLGPADNVEAGSVVRRAAGRGPVVGEQRSKIASRHTSCTRCSRCSVRTKIVASGMPTKGSVSPCPRCKSPVPQKGRGRAAIWCSQACRRAAYEERRAAGSGAVAVEVVDRVTVTEHDLSECVQRVT